MSIVLVAASLAAAVIHFALGPEHLEELGWLGAGFYVAGLLQLAWAGLAVVASLPHRAAWARAGRVLIPAGVAINAAFLAAWFVSRTVGLPAGEHPWTQQAIGLSDAITALLEAGLVLGLVVSWRRRPATGGTSAATQGAAGYPSLVGAAPILALILVAAVAAVGAPHAHADGGTHDAGVMPQEQHAH